MKRWQLALIKSIVGANPNSDYDKFLEKIQKEAKGEKK